METLDELTRFARSSDLSTTKMPVKYTDGSGRSTAALLDYELVTEAFPGYRNVRGMHYRRRCVHYAA